MRNNHIIIDNETYNMMSKIMNASDKEVPKILSENNITSNDFKTFMNEEGLNDDLDANTILEALRSFENE